MQARLFSTLVVFALLVVSVSPPAQAKPADTLRSAPRLVVFVAVDQMRADYVEKFQHQWKHGLRRLLDRGAVFRQAAFPYLNTVTCPGHATLSTGTYPATHGMILNTWWDRAAGKLMACTDDLKASLVAYGDQPIAALGDSARHLRVPTLADEMRVQLSPPPRIVSFSMKPRSALMMAGQRADAVAWFESSSLVTSTAYTTAPLAFLTKLVRSNPLDRAINAPWTKLLPDRAYLYEDNAAEEKPPIGWTKTFPHPLKHKPTTPATPAQPAPAATSLWEQSPASDRFLAQMARAALVELELGKGPATDYLAVSFSSLDRVGHAFGPRSHEVQDVLAQLDVTLGGLLADLDKRVGPQNYVLAFSSDHGVAPYPEQMVAHGLDAGRVPMDKVNERMTSAISKALGPGDHVASLQYTDLYLAPGVADKLRNKPGAMKLVLEAVQSVPGVARAFSSYELQEPSPSKDPLRRAALLSHFPGRSGDIILVPRPHWLTTSSGTTHGTQNEYDQRVPVILMGAGIRPGQYFRAVSPADIAPTLALVIGVILPRPDGQPLVEALAAR